MAKSGFFQENAKLTKNIEVAPNCYKMLLSAPFISRSATPGQFVNVRIGTDYENLLRRPFSIHNAASQIEILYEVVGKGTEVLSQKKPGERLDVIGPLGKGFSILDARCSILVAGGMGVAPLFFLAQQARIKDRASSIEVLIGARTQKQILCEKEFKKLGCQVQVSTDDGSKGFKGMVTDLLKIHLSSDVYHRISVVYACGPRFMLKEVSRIAKEYKIPAQVSLEEHMACGIGACFGCVVKTRDGYKRVCKDGPVFEAGEVIF